MTNIAMIAHACTRQVHRLDIVANNIANVDTPGFKAERLYFSRIRPRGTGARSVLKEIAVTDYSPGVIRKTDNSLDLAILGKGFFVIQTKSGLAYTRDGRFTLNRDRELVTQKGDYVLGKSGKVVITGNNIKIAGNGVITVDGNEIDRLRVVDFRKPSALLRLGNNLYQDPNGSAGPKPERNPEIQSGYIESSNVQAIKEMVKLIDIQRSFEFYQKLIQTVQDQNRLSTNSIGQLK